MPKDLWAKRRDIKWVNLKVDEYTYGLVERAVSEGKASSMVEAVGKAMSDLLGIPHKTVAELKLEKDLARVLELGKKATKEEDEDG